MVLMPTRAGLKLLGPPQNLGGGEVFRLAVDYGRLVPALPQDDAK